MSKNHIEQAEKLINCLKKTNNFQRSRNAQENVEKATPETLSMYKIVIEKNFSFDQTTFEYRPEKGIVIRTKFTGISKYENRDGYRYKSCKCFSCENPCYKEEYSIEDFIDLINRGVFEPINIYPI